MVQHLGDVLALFLIPVGGGIPAGVLLARNHAIPWPVTALLYFVSDVILACVFEPLMRAVVQLGKRSARLSQAMRSVREKNAVRYGTAPGPLALIGISFGIDPMTGRSMAAAVGHGFVTGWLIAIAGDMIYFGLIMASTLWLDGILGNGTVTSLIILGLMIGLPPIIRRVQAARRRS